MATTTNPNYTEQVQSNIPAWMQKYADPLLGMVFGDPSVPGSGLMNLGYQPYMVAKRDAEGNIIKDKEGNPVLVEGQRVAGFSPLQQRAFTNLAGMGISPELAKATDLATIAGNTASRLNYNPAAAENYYTSPAYQGMGTTFERTTAPQLQQYQMGAPRDVNAERVASTYDYTPERVAAYQYAQLAMDPAERVRAQRLQEYRMGPAAQVTAEQFGLGSAARYMSPYMQDVVERQKRAAIQDYARGIPAIQAAGIRAGGRGGTREALIESEARRNLANQMGDIEAGGLQSAYQQAMQQYNVDQAQRMQAQLANQAAIQDVARQNLQAAMGIQSLGAGQSLEAQRLNQAAGLTVGQQNLAAEQARQQFMGQQALTAQQLNQAAFQRSAEFGSAQQMQAALANQQAALQAALANQQADLSVGKENLAARLGVQSLGAQQGLQAQQLNQAAQLQAQQQALAERAAANQFAQQNAQQRAQYGLAGANLAEQSRQFGANYGLSGIQQQLAAAGALGGLGMQGYQQRMGVNQALLGAGGQQQALDQQLLNTQYQDFLNQQLFPYKQAEFGMNMLRGIPSTATTSTLYQQPGNLFGQIVGAGAGVAGLGGLFGGIGQTTGGP